MKKIVRTGIGICLILIASCTDYSDDFANLNERIDGLESQIAGFSELSTGVGALDSKIESLRTVVDAIPDNAGFSSSVGEIQDQIDMLQEALALLLSNASTENISAIDGLAELLSNSSTENSVALAGLAELLSNASTENNAALEALADRLEAASDDNLDAVSSLSGSLQEQIDALYVALGLINEDVKELLNANNVYPGDMIILTDAALDEAIAYAEGRETLIIDGAFVIDADYTVPTIVPEEDREPEVDNFMDTPFSAAKVNQLTSKIVAILGHDWAVGLIEESDDSIYGEYGEVPFAGEIKNVDGALDLSNLRSLTGHIEIGDIAGDVDMSSLTRARFIESLEFNYNEGDIIDGEEYSDLDDVYEDELFDAGGLIFDNVAGDVDLSSLRVAFSVKFEEVSGQAKLDSLVSILEDLASVKLGSLNAPVLREVGDDLELEYGGGYEFPELVWVDSNLSLVDVEGDNPTVKVDFPKLAHVGSPISIYESFASLGCCGSVDKNSLDHIFSNATYISILGLFEQYDDYTKERTYRGFSAPLAELIIINGDQYIEADESIVDGSLYVYAPEAAVALSFTETGENWGSGDLDLSFNTLTANKLTYIDGSLFLFGPDYDSEQPEVVVNFPELDYIYGIASTGYVDVSNVLELNMPKYDQSTDIIYTSQDLAKFTAASIYDYNVVFSNLEALTLTALKGEFDFATFRDGLVSADMAGPSDETLADVNITGADCSASVYIGTKEKGTAYDALETLTLAGTLNIVNVFGADGLTTVNTSGTITSWNFDDNSAVTTNTDNHTDGTCDNEEPPINNPGSESVPI